MWSVNLFSILISQFIVLTLQNDEYDGNHKDPLLAEGRAGYVHLFEWTWKDIALECERFLGPNGYGGVQVSPPTEHPLIKDPIAPWWQKYQPASYKLQGRSGTREEFVDMVERCNDAGVRIYVDAIINHLTPTNGVGTAGSVFRGQYLDFPDVPYDSSDFNDKLCNSSNGGIVDMNDAYQIRNCRLLGMPDLATGKPEVQDKIAKFLNELIDIGVAGFRIDAAKHIWPNDLDTIASKLKNVRSDIFGQNKRPFLYHEVTDKGIPEVEAVRNNEYTKHSRVTEFHWGLVVSDAILKQNGRKLSDLQEPEFGSAFEFVPSGDAMSFIDNHDNQRGHGCGGVLSYFNPREYKIANAITFAWPYGFPQVMSSYDFIIELDNLGPPTNDNIDVKPVIINRDGTCGNGWICEHRWREISNMIRFNIVSGNEAVEKFWNEADGHQIAFSRGDKAFIAINNHNSIDLTQNILTNLPDGTYCDIISGYYLKDDNKCTGKEIEVVGSEVNVDIKYTEKVPIIAIHLESKKSDP